jgi:hypothetical protein
VVDSGSKKKSVKKDKKKKKVEKKRYRDLWKDPEMKMVSLILSYANFSLYICYYGMIFALP